MNALAFAKQKGASISDSVFTNAKTYLKNEQLADGGWGFGASDPLTTSWVIMGLNALGEGQTDWFNSSGKNPWYPLVEQLNTAGYYEPSWAPGTVDWFGTKHAVTALLGKSWPITLNPRTSTVVSVASPVENTNSNGSGSGGDGTTVSQTSTLTPSSTPEQSTSSTPEVAPAEITPASSTPALIPPETATPSSEIETLISKNAPLLWLVLKL